MPNGSALLPVSTLRAAAWLRMLRVFVIRDLREQYAGTLLGGLWAIVQPLLLVAIYWWIFGYVWALKVPGMRADSGDLPFILFLLSALLPWLAFQDAVNKSATAVLSRADVLRHGNFPVAVFPVARCAAAHLVFACLILAFTLVGRGSIIAAAPELIPGLIVLYGLQLGFSCGIGMLLAALAVYIRDLPHLLSMLLMGVFFTAPVLYPVTQIPEGMRAWIWLNPYTPFALGFQSLLLKGQWPEVAVWVYTLVVTLMSWMAGAFVFRRLRPGFADVV